MTIKGAINIYNHMQTLSLTNRAELSLSGIKKIRTTEPHQVVAHLDGTMIIITGQNLSVQNLSISEGLLDITGQIDSIRYTKSHARKFSLKNMFK